MKVFKIWHILLASIAFPIAGVADNQGLRSLMYAIICGLCFNWSRKFFKKNELEMSEYNQLISFEGMRAKLIERYGMPTKEYILDKCILLIYESIQLIAINDSVFKWNQLVNVDKHIYHGFMENRLNQPQRLYEIILTVDDISQPNISIKLHKDEILANEIYGTLNIIIKRSR